MEKSNFTASEPSLLYDRRVVQKRGVSYRGKKYWHSNLGEYRGKVVSIKAEPDSPVEIEIFYDDQLICVAQRLDQEKAPQS